MRKLYGYTMTMVGKKQALGIPDQEEAKNVMFIYESYLEGHSLGGIVKLLQEKEILSPTGKDTWGRAAIDQLLSNEKYMLGIIDKTLFKQVQQEKQNRCNVDKTQGKSSRKTTHYSSKKKVS